jgi:cystathionine gamma-synthase
MAISAKLQMPPTHGALYWTDPSAFAMARGYALSDARKDKKLSPEDLTYKCVDVNGVRLYLVYYPMQKTPGIIESWQNPGTGVSSRLAEALLPYVGSLKEVPCDGYNPPSTPFLPEGPAHAKLRERVSSLLHRGAIDPEMVKVTPDDVFLYVTGMAGIYHEHNLLLEYRPGTVVILGIAFHNTFHHVKEKSVHGFKHFGPVDGKGVDALEAWLEEETREGRKVSYLFVEFPSNPLLCSVDLRRVKSLVSLGSI